MLAKISKIARFILLLLIFSIGLIYIVFKSRPVQTWLVQKATFYLSDELGTKVRVGGVDIDFFKTLVLEHVYIEDLHQDTLFYFRNIKADYNDFDNIKRIISLNEFSVEGGKILFGYHKGDTVNNYDFFIDFFDGGPRDTAKPHITWTVFSKKVNLENTRFDYFDENEVQPDYMDFNYNDLSFTSIRASLENFYLIDDSLHFKSKHFAFNEKCGLKVTEFIADTKIHGGGLEFDNLIFKTINKSDIRDRIILSSKSWRDYNDFNNKIFMKANLKDAKIDSKDLAYFSHYLKEYQTPIYATGYAEGYLVKLQGKNSRFKFFDNTVFEGDWTLEGLPDIDNTLMIFEVDDFKSNFKDLSKISLNNLPSNMSTLGNIKYKGTFSGYYNDFVTYGKLKTDIGSFDTDINLKYKDGLDNATYSGKIKTDLFLLKTFLPSSPFDATAFDLKINGSGITAEKYNIAIEGDINKLVFNSYAYQNIKAKGVVSKDLFSGEATIRDPHLNLDFVGVFNAAADVPEADFKANIVNADLGDLGIDNQKQTIKGEFNLNFKGKNIDEAVGSITGKNISIFRNNNLVEIPFVSFSSQNINSKLSGENQKELKLESEIVDIDIIGQYKFSLLDVSIRHMIHQLIPIYFDKPKQVLPAEDFNFKIDMKQPEKLTSLYLPELNVAPFAANGFYKTEDQTIGLVTYVSKLDYNDFHVSNLYIDADKVKDNLLKIDVTADAFTDNKNIKITDIKIISDVSDNTINYSLSGADTGYSISLITEGKILFAKDSINLEISKAKMFVDNDEWLLNEDASILITDDIYNLTNIIFKNKLQSLNLNGEFGGNSNNSLNLNIDNFALNSINSILKGKNLPLLNGESRGNIIYTTIDGKPVISSNLSIKNLSIENDTVGNLTITSASKEGSARQDVNIQIDGGTLDSLSVFGVIDFTSKSENLDLKIVLPPSEINIFQPFLKDIVSDIEGQVYSNNLLLSGTFENPNLKGDIFLKDAEMIVDYLKIPISFSTVVKVDNNIFRIEPFNIFDDRGHKGIVKCSFKHNNFRDFKLDLDISELNKFHILNTYAADNSLYHGQAYANGSATFKGPLDNLDIKIDIVTTQGTFFYLPITQGDASGFPNYVHFKSAKKRIKKTEDDFPIHSLIMDIEATDDANIEIIFDETLGDKISATGVGNIKMEMTKSGDFYMFGTYKVIKGKYLFTAFDLYNKPFNIKPGGTVTWYGDPLEAQLNLVAFTSERANPNPLLLDASLDGSTLPPVITAESSLIIKGNLMTPDITFGFDCPKLVSEVTGKISVALNSTIARIKADKEEVSRQVFSLLIMKQFVTPSFAQNGLTTSNVGSTALSTAGSDLLSSQLSNWLSKIDPTWKINVIYKNGTPTLKEEYGVALSKKFLNERLSFDGSYSNFSNIPNINVEYKLTKKGYLSVKAYTRSNVNQVSSTSVNTPITTTGVGLVYTKEFNRFRLLKKNRKKKPKKNYN